MPSWPDWTAHHAGLFALTGDAARRSLVEWVRLFQSQGFTAEELWEATDHLAAKSAAMYPTEQLQRLQDRVRALRRRPADERPASDSGSVCGLCQGSGWCSVPSRKALNIGTIGTEAVTCRCPLGLWFAREWSVNPPKAGPPTSLEEYEREVPQWREVVAQRRAVGERLETAGAMASALDRIFGRIKSRSISDA